MKKSLLFTTLVIGLALTGCNKSTRTSTAATDSTTTPPPADTTVAARTEAASREVAADVRRGASNAAEATREAGRDVRDATRSAGSEIREAGRDASAALANAGDKLHAKYTEWKLNAQDLDADIAAKRPIVRTKDIAGAPTGTMDKSTLQSAVEGRIKADAELANLKLDINADRKGEIQLEGKAQNAGQIAHAMALALDTDGVYKVTSKIRIDDDAVKNP
ncbi:MAG: BON domain-containing protein [Opitutaceae bacterium]|nr:BON domain-containing protein [Opitutaceae bacterium]